MADGYKVIFMGKVTECYGELEEDSNFHVVCEDEDEDNVWCDGHPQERDWIDWDDVVMTLQPFYNSDIIEITAV